MHRNSVTTARTSASAIRSDSPAPLRPKHTPESCSTPITPAMQLVRASQDLRAGSGKPVVPSLRDSDQRLAAVPGLRLGLPAFARCAGLDQSRKFYWG